MEDIEELFEDNALVVETSTREGHLEKVFADNTTFWKASRNDDTPKVRLRRYVICKME